MDKSRFRRARGGMAGALAIIAVIVTPVAGRAADLYAPDAVSMKDTHGGDHDCGSNHSTLPAGVYGAGMVCEGQNMLMYTPMYMSMQGNYIGTSKASASTILAMPNQMFSATGQGPKYLRMLPENMDGQMHMLHYMYGVSDAINIMVMGSYIQKNMTMTTYASPSQLVGTRTYTTDGIGDVSVVGLFRLYQDRVNHVHINLGLGVPTGSTTEQMNMLAPSYPMISYMTMRAAYGMQIGTGTYNFLPGLSYTANLDKWSWGAAYRGFFPLNDDQGYHWGDSNEVTGWLGYTVIPGVTATGRIAGSIQDKIQGRDLQIFGGMEGANPAYYGGERVDLFGGIEIAGKEFGLGHTRFAIEAGAPVYQNLNGPQLGRDWQLNAAFGISF